VRWLLLEGDLAIFEGARVRWATMRASFDKAPPKGAERFVRVKRLPDALRAAFGDLLRGLTSPSCILPMITREDVDPMAIPTELKDRALSSVERSASGVTDACAAAETAIGPWEASMRTLNVIVRAGDHVVDLRADTTIESADHVCLGPMTLRRLE
jgi:hypothetical protein